MMPLLCRLTATALLLSVASGLRSETSAASTLTFNAEAAKNRPVSKVIKLLKDMLSELDKESEKDEEVYDAMACWCETNDKEKTASIAAAESRITDLTTKIEDHTAKSARLSTELKALEKEMASDQSALEKATGIREKQLSEFSAEEQDLVESIAALKSAVTVLSKHTPSLLQISQRHLATVRDSVQRAVKKHGALLAGALTHSERRAVTSFIQAHEDDFDAAPAFKQAYAPQSGDILGILKQMKETFESNLSTAQKEEMANQKAYDEVNKAKKDEIAAATEQIDKKTMQLATTDEKNAQASEDLEDTQNALAADEKFLAMLKEKCASMDKEFEERRKTRAEEIEATSKALAILSSDDAHDLFTKTFNPALLQKANSMNSARRSQASKLLSAVAQKMHSSQLSTLAVKVRIAAFTAVKKAIEDMVKELLAEKAAEIKKKDFCVEEFDQNQLQTEKAERQKEAATAKTEDLEMTIKTLTEDIETLKAEIKEMKVQMKRGSEDREKENKDFQMTIADQRATQQLLVAALNVLKGFFDKEASLLQRQEPAGPAPPPGFKEYKKNEKSGGVMGMIQQIIDDAKAVENEAIVAEADAQKSYEAFVRDTNESIELKEKAVINKGQSKAEAEGELGVAKDSLETAEDSLESLAKYKGELHESCDFLLKNFEIRQTSRDEEVEALRQAMAILSGAKFGAFLQR